VPWPPPNRLPILPIPGRLGALPCPICCIIPRILVKSPISLLMSVSFCPEPLATRRRRLGDCASRSGSERSSGVMELMAASVRLSCTSPFSRSSPLSLFMPGISFMMLPNEPMFFSSRICLRKSLKSNRASSILACICSASAMSISSWARSTSETTSPMPRMREAMRSG